MLQIFFFFNGDSKITREGKYATVIFYSFVSEWKPINLVIANCKIRLLFLIWIHHPEFSSNVRVSPFYHVVKILIGGWHYYGRSFQNIFKIILEKWKYAEKTKKKKEKNIELKNILAKYIYKSNFYCKMLALG